MDVAVPRRQRSERAVPQCSPVPNSTSDTSAGINDSNSAVLFPELPDDVIAQGAKSFLLRNSPAGRKRCVSVAINVATQSYLTQP